MIETYHFYKWDCFASSRLLLQASWDYKSTFVHLPNRKTLRPTIAPAIDEIKLSIVSLIKIAFTRRTNLVAIFHAQSSLPYLILFRSIVFISRKKNISLVYDMHDYLEYEPMSGLYSRIRFGLLRYRLLAILEFLCARDKSIKIITVSQGLADTLASKYHAMVPTVIRSIPKAPIFPTAGFPSFQSQNNKCMVYFGTIAHAPLLAIKKISDEGLRIDLYGRDIDKDSLILRVANIDLSNVSICGAYQPADLGFLEKYSILLLYRPEVTSINYRYALPNKLFQALGYGLSMLISDNFVEMRRLFSDIPGAIGTLDAEDSISSQINHLLAMRAVDYKARIKEKLDALHNESELNYKKLFSWCE